MKFLYCTAPGRLSLKLLLSAGVFNRVARWLGSPFSKVIIKPFIRYNRVDMNEFQGQEYGSFSDFFKRRRNSDVCVPASPNIFISPCDGMLSVYDITDEACFKVKGTHYSVSDLIPEPEIADTYEDGLCLIFRLRACDYHHFCYIDNCTHGPIHFIEGMLHSVQPIALSREPVFYLNRRTWSIMNTENFGSVAQIEVGALFVGEIEHTERAACSKTNYTARRGEDMGHFALCGSTIIILLNKETKDRLHIKECITALTARDEEYPVKMGDIIGHRTIH